MCINETLYIMTLLEKIENYVELHIGEFHDSRIEKLKSMDLQNLLKRKNPYLYKAKNLATPADMVESLASAYVSSSEEAIFGDWLEKVAIFVAQEVYGGRKSTSEGIDLEMNIDGTHYAVSIKSGPHWSNSSSRQKMLDNFKKAARIFRTSRNNTHFMCVEGICYGKDTQPDKGNHLRLCGEKFWTFLSGDPHLYLDIIKPLGTKAQQKNQEYKKEYNRMLSRFTREFSNAYCLDNGDINWEKIVHLNSGYKTR